MARKLVNHLDDILKNQLVRNELRDNLGVVVSLWEEKILKFAKNNIEVQWSSEKNWLKNDNKEFLKFIKNNNLIEKLFSAVYHANSKYYNTKLNHEKDEVNITIPAIGPPAKYYNYGEHKHQAVIPTARFKSGSTLLFAMDAESRHAVHNNILYKKGSTKDNRCDRAYLVITETIDEGMSYGGEIDTPHFDPFLNDIFLDNGEDGHNGAGFFCKHLLDKDPFKKYQQLNWLIRQKIRKKLPSNVEITNYKIKLNDIIKNLGEEKSVYNYTVDPLRCYYSGIGFVDYRMLSINQARDDAIANSTLRYDPKDAVLIRDSRGINVVTKFASQLDYIALKLKTTQPDILFKLAGL